MAEQPAPRRSRPVRLALAFFAAAVMVGLPATILVLLGARPAPRLAPVVVVAAAVAALTTAGNLLLRFLRWQFLLRRLEVRLHTIPSLGAFVGSFAFLPVPLYLGQLVARTRLLGPLGEARRTLVIAAFLWERAFDVWALAVLSIVWSPWLGFLALVIGITIGAVRGVRVRVLDAIARAARLLSQVQASGPPPREAGMPIQATTASVWAGAAFASLGAWVLTVAAASLLARVTHVGLGSLGTASAAAHAILLGALSMVPLGAGVSGVMLFNDLSAAGSGSAAQMVFLFRLTTVWLTVALGALAAVLAVRRSRRPTEHDHFDAVSDCYDAWLPIHYRQHLVRKKTAPMLERLAYSAEHSGLERPASGLDIGCGRGWYARELRDAGARIVGLDLSFQQLLAARDYLGGDVPLLRGSVFDLPFRSSTFDFAYIINALHHLESPRDQIVAIEEMGRILRPGGTLFVHEMNARNPLFRFYLGYVFPILKGIEEGWEHYMDPRKIPPIPGLRLTAVHYSTFLPDFVTPAMLATLAPIERRLERSFLAPYAAHFVAVFERTARSSG